VEENVSSTSQVKNSVQRSIQVITYVNYLFICYLTTIFKSQVIQQYPTLEPIIDQILPKKLMVIARWYVYALQSDEIKA
jgi:hypothetical protein